MLKFESIISPESFSMDSTPLKVFAIELSCIFFKWTQNFHIILQDSWHIFDTFNQVFIFDVAFEECIRNFEESVIIEKFKAYCIRLNIFEN